MASQISKFKYQNNTKPGSSLILVLLIIAGVVTVIFGAQRVTLVQFNQSNREEDNISAYYAAKAGIEDGLIRYRFERNVETLPGKVFRHNVTSGVPEATEVDEAGSIGGVVNYRPTDQYYDLKIAYKTDRININGLTGATEFTADRKIAKDDLIQLTGFESGNSSYFLRYAFRFDPSCSSENLSRAFVQVEKITTAGALTQENALPTNGLFDSKAVAKNLPINSSGDLASTVRFRPFYCAVEYALATTNTNDGSGDSNNAGPKFDSLTTTITATGYYGSAKRTLIGTVNRLTGQLIGVYSFNAYSGTSDIEPRP